MGIVNSTLMERPVSTPGVTNLRCPGAPASVPGEASGEVANPWRLSKAPLTPVRRLDPFLKPFIYFE